MSAAGGPSSSLFVRVYIETDLPTDRRTKKNQTVRESELSCQQLQRPRRWEEKGCAQKTNFRNKSAILMVCVAGGGEKAVKETKDLHFRFSVLFRVAFPETFTMKNRMLRQRRGRWLCFSEKKTEEA